MKKWFLTLILTGIILTLTNSCKKEESEDLVLPEPSEVPVLVTTNVSDITYTSAISGGEITSDGGATITAQGVCWGTGQMPTVSDNKTNESIGDRNFTSNLTGLVSGTTYYARAYAVNNVGTAYGDVVSFTTIPLEVTDIDGNVYHTVIIGSQVWMVENLKTTKYRNGESIPKVIGETWDNLTTGAYCIYDDNEDNRIIYGLLYNWYAVSDNRNICPEGWHIPTIEEWRTLAHTGLELKESGTTHWKSPNSVLPNSSGFMALPGGSCQYDGYFGQINERGTWWTADEGDATGAWFWELGDATGAWFWELQNDGSLSGYSALDKWFGFSVRCIMD